MNKILEINDLKVSFQTYAGKVQAVRGVSFSVEEGETLAIVGESGCGKSVTIQTVMGLNPSPPSLIEGGTIIFEGKDLLKLTESEMEKLRGGEISMIFQDPMTSLNPTKKVGKQIKEAIVKHMDLSNKEAVERTMDMMRLVGISNPHVNMFRFPHTYSGGMRQRIMIAMGMAANPKVLLADEPTTALDVTTQSQILDLMNKLKKERNMAVILITHNLGVVARMADKVAVMYAGRIVEYGTAREVFYEPKHPYTWGLLNSMPDIGGSDGSYELTAIPGTPPDLFAPPEGCAFAARCPYTMNCCVKVQPPEYQLGGSHRADCYLLDDRAPQVAEFKVKRRIDDVSSSQQQNRGTKGGVIGE